ncbi:MAG TPA: hypothetical protein VIP52_07970 [Candidatus Dormibacteraeota bacterium]
MDTAELMAVALAQAGLQEVPPDSGVHIEGSGLRRALFGIDIDVADLLFAREAGFDVVVAHHPVGDGGASVQFTEVMWRQVEQMTEVGIAQPIARAAVAERVATVHRRRHLANHNRVLDTARLIGLPLLNIHLPPDIVTRRFLEDLLAERTDPGTTIGALLEQLGQIPEMQRSLVKPEAWIGDLENELGRAVVAVAGTNGGYPVFQTYYAAGVRTILAMHIDEADFLRLRAEIPADCNFVVTGHMPSDSIGINRLIWGLEDRGLECIRTSGIIGVPRPASA